MNNKNLATSLLAAPVSESATTAILQTGYGALMPPVPFHVTATKLGAISVFGNSEIWLVTAISGDTLTIQRGQRGTTARPFESNDIVSNAIYVEDLNLKANTSEVVNKSGDTMTGTLTVPSAIVSDQDDGIHTNTTSGLLRLSGGPPSNGGSILLGGSTNGAVANRGTLRVGYDGNMQWDVNRTEFVNRPVRINGVDYLTGSGFPNGVVFAPVGSIYIDKNVTNGASSWIKRSGTGNTGWVVSKARTSRAIPNTDLLNGWTATGGVMDTMKLVRDGNTVTLFLPGVVGPDGTDATSNLFYLLPPGFRINTNGNYGLVGLGRTGGVISSVGKDFAHLTAARGNGVTEAVLTWDTKDGWPTTLPGIPAYLEPI